MRGINREEEAIAGAFEELPALLVVLIAISLFSVSFAYATTSWAEDREYLGLQEDCRTFSSMVRSSTTFCGDCDAGLFDLSRVQNITNYSIQNEFNSTILDFDYRVSIQPIEGNSSITFQTSEILDMANVATYHTCVNVLDSGNITSARLIVSIWRLSE